ncbi:MAG TPA: alanine racemase, partial [Aestuariivirga sp.]|nr:alanine racemase [Aestuariivirga sp.]
IIGMIPVGRALWSAGCRHYFVARPMEGADLRAILPEAEIYVLDGLFPGQAEFYARHRLRPALTALDEAREGPVWPPLWPQAALRAACRYRHQPPRFQPRGIPRPPR